jgi:hypothetical protein
MTVISDGDLTILVGGARPSSPSSGMRPALAFGRVNVAPGIERKPLLDAAKECADRRDFEGLYNISDKLGARNARFNEAREVSGSAALERVAEALEDEI